MIAVNAQLQLAPERAADFESAFTALAAKVRASEPGCRLYQLVRSRKTPGSYQVFELYESEAALGAHMASPYVGEAEGLLGGYLTAAPVIDVFETVD